MIRSTQNPALVIVTLASWALVSAARADVTCKDLPANAPPSVRAAVCGSGKPAPTDADLHAQHLDLLARQLAQFVEGAVWCGRAMRPPAPAKACFTTRALREPLCARTDELRNAAAAALRAAGLSKEAAAFMAPGLANEVRRTFDSNQESPTQPDVAKNARAVATVMMKSLAEGKARELAQRDEKQSWKVDVRAAEFTKTRTKELAEARVHDLMTMPTTAEIQGNSSKLDARTENKCRSEQLWLKKVDRLNAEVKRLLTSTNAKHWRALATNVSAASGGTRDYHDRYALAEALVGEDAAWLDAEQKREDESSSETTPPAVHAEQDAHDIDESRQGASSEVPKHEHGDPTDAGISDPSGETEPDLQKRR